MIVTFDEAVPEAAREILAKYITRSHEVGLPVKSLITRIPGTDMTRPMLDEERITYLFALDADGNIHVTVKEN